MPVWTARTWFEQLFADKYPSAFTVNGFSTCDHRDRDRELMASPASGNGWWVRLPNILRRPIDFADPPQLGIVDQFTADHVFAIDEDDRFVLRGDLGERRLSSRSRPWVSMWLKSAWSVIMTASTDPVSAPDWAPVR